MTEQTGAARQTGAAPQPGQWRLDPQASRAEFAVPHFWHLITVRGQFDRIDGEGTIAPDGTATGRLVLDAASLNTRNQQRDKHLRSADFFSAEQHPEVVLTVSRAVPAGDGRLTAEATLEAAGVSQPVSLTADVADASPDAVTLRGELTVDRSRFGMTWSPLRMADLKATATVTARFTRVPAGSPAAAGQAVSPG